MRKIDDDPKSALTEADIAAQVAIVSALRSAWPGISIVGEEDGDERAAVLDDSDASLAPLRRDLCPAASSDLEAALSEITIFVDPLDGSTRRGRSNCAILTTWIHTARGPQPRSPSTSCPLGLAGAPARGCRTVRCPFPRPTCSRPALRSARIRGS